MSAFPTQATVTKWLTAFACAGVLALLSWPAGLLVPDALAQEDAAPAAAPVPPTDPVVPLDLAEYALEYPARELDEPGIIKNGGYCTAGARMLKYSYRSATGGATIEVVEHPLSYPYVKHDFLGTFFWVKNERERKGGRDGSEVLAPLAYIEWKTAKLTDPHMVCVLRTSSARGHFGIAGWYSEMSGRITTVMLRFSAPEGLPRAVIDDFLSRYPSTIQGRVPSLESWEADDIAKWTALLQSREDDDLILDLAGKHLRRYNPGAFGLMEAWNKRSDAAALADAIDKSIQRMNAWLDDHEKSKRRDAP